MYDNLIDLLGAYDINCRRLEILDIPQGADNLNILFACESGRFVFRCYKVTPDDEIPFELEVIERLHRMGFPTAAVIRTKGGRLLTDTMKGAGALFHFVDGRPIDPRTPGSLEKAVALLTELHRLMRGMQVETHRRRSRTDASRIRRLESMLSGCEDTPQARSLIGFAQLARETSDAFENRAATATPALPFGIIHHDFNPGNILVNECGDVVALLDFDEAHEGHLLLDLAALLHYWCYDLDAGLNLAAAAEAVAHYHRRRPLTPEERDCVREAILLNLAADASDYLAGEVARGHRNVQLDSCHSYQRFSRLRAIPNWERRLLEGLPGT